MQATLMWTPPVPQDPEVDWLATDPDFGSMILIDETWVNLGSFIQNESLRARIARRLIDYYEKLYIRLILEDGFGSSELIEDLDYIKDAIMAWRLWERGQDLYVNHSARWAEANMKAYGMII